jgi:hypothetical protein
MKRIMSLVATLWVVCLLSFSGNALAVSSDSGSGAFVINYGLNDTWYDPMTAGQGFTIAVFEDKGTVFLSWLTYDTQLPEPGATANLGDPGQRWLTASGPYEGSQAELVVYSASGGLFDNALPAPELNPIGSILLDFVDCSSGMVTYDLPGIGRSGSIPIERTASDNIAVCEMLSPTESPTGACYVPEGEIPTTFKPMFAVWGSGGNDVFAVGGLGTILHYDGSDWTPMAWGGDFGFEGVWGSSSEDVYAVGGFDGFGLALGVIWRYDGTCWREVFSTTEFQFTDVWGSSNRNVFAATSRGPVLHYDGTGWAPMTTGTEAMDGLGGVWGTGASNVFAVGGDEIWRYDGNSWQLMASVNANSLRRVWGSGATDIFAVGRYTSQETAAGVWHFDGASWKFMPADTSGMRWGVWGSSHNNVFVVGDVSGHGLISRYDGVDWNTALATRTPTLQGVWGSSASDVFAVGGGARNGSCCSGEGTILHFNGNSWQTVMEYGQFQ